MNTPYCSFVTSTTTLEDRSTVHDVRCWTPDGMVTIAEPPSARCALELADALNAVRKAILDCGSDREVVQLSQRITNALTGE